MLILACQPVSILSCWIYNYSGTKPVAHVFSGHYSQKLFGYYQQTLYFSEAHQRHLSIHVKNIQKRMQTGSKLFRIVRVPGYTTV